MTKKRMSHYERMQQVVGKRPVCYNRPYTVYDDDDVVDKSGVMVKASVIKTVLPSDRFKGLRVSDFALSNVIAAGAVDMLKPTALDDTTLTNVDRIDGAINNIMDMIDANDKNNSGE